MGRDAVRRDAVGRDAVGRDAVGRSALIDICGEESREPSGPLETHGA